MMTLEQPTVWPSLGEAAEILDISKSTLSRACHSQQLPYTVVGFGKGRYALSPKAIFTAWRTCPRVSRDEVLTGLARVIAKHTHESVDVLIVKLRPFAEAESADTSTADPKLEQYDRSIQEISRLRHELRSNPDQLMGQIHFMRPGSPPQDAVIRFAATSKSEPMPVDEEAWADFGGNW